MKKILFLDTLTTGMNTERCAIYHLGGIYTEDGIETVQLDLKVRPFVNARINEQSLWIGGVDRSVVVHYPDQEQAFKTFIDFLDSVVDVRNSNDKMYLAGFNAAAFDVPFLYEWFRRNGNERFRDYFHMQTLDMMSVAAFGLIGRRRAMPDFKLESVARELGIPVPDTQNCDCITNARVALEIFRFLQQRFGIDEYTDDSFAEKFVRNF